MTFKINQQKDTFVTILLILTLVLMLLPFMATFNDILTRLIIKLDYYRFVQNIIVPWEVRMVGVLLWPFGFQPAVMGDYLALGGGPSPTSAIGKQVAQAPFLIEIAWNCVGWQSLLFFIITAFIGLQGDQYSWVSKIKALLIGVLGTFIINLLRITGVALTAYYLGQNVAMVLHDYGSTLLIIIWLFFFWWFSYKFVLEEN